MAPIPIIYTPHFWPASLDAIEAELTQCASGAVEEIGTSAGSHPLWGVSYRTETDAPTFAVVGGLHGHECQGVATCLNLVSLLERGEDLRGVPRPNLPRDLNWLIIPIANPDARRRNLNSFVGLTRQDVFLYGPGLRKDGAKLEKRDHVSPVDMIFLGGLHNDAGMDLYLDNEPGGPLSPELHAILDYLAPRRPNLVLELHAHCAPPLFYAPFDDLPEDIKGAQVELAEQVANAGRAEFEFDKAHTGPLQGRISANLYYDIAGALPMLVELPQGVWDSGPRWDHGKIVDCGLFIVEAIARGIGDRG